MGHYAIKMDTITYYLLPKTLKLGTPKYDYAAVLK